MRNQIITVFVSVLVTAVLFGLTQSHNLLANNNNNTANIAPAYISHQGFLADSNGDPVTDGSYDIQVGIYTAVSGGSLIWQETHTNAPISQGFFAITLGNGDCTIGCPLSADTFSGTARYLQTSVDTGTGFVDFPRQLLSSVPYAFQASQAASVPWSGVTNPPDISDTLDDLNCTSNEIAKWDGTNWVCAPDDNSDTLDDLNCTANEIAKWDGTNWACAPDDNSDTLSDLSCANGQIAKWDGTAWACAEDLVGAGGGNNYENVIVVAKSGGDFTSVATALNSINDATAENRYLVRVAPGIYEESSLVTVPGYVHMRGDGPATSIITSNRSNSTPNQNAATIYMLENSYLSDIGVRNTGTGSLSYGIYMVETTRATIIDNVDVVVDGVTAGAGARSGIHLNSAAPTIKNSSFKASGTNVFDSSVNAGLTSVHTAGGGFPQALILNSIFLGGANSTVQSCNDNSGTGFGMQLNQATPDIRYSHICGGHRGIALLQNGQPNIKHSEIRVSSNNDAYLFELSSQGSISVSSSGLSFFDNNSKVIGPGSGLRCVHNYDWGTWQPLNNGIGAATACNK